ncbi:FAD-binding oxidoreductase [Microlunatus ginsengisoli]|uniref:FAD-binding oxidoreductase n=1 Tax=Microlunatus ginsengisoli TaxID=363863 RepID=A0ABP7AJV0_9ACTN
MTIEFELTETDIAAATAIALRDVDAEIHLPGDPGYDAARMPWNVAADLRPAAVAYPSTAREVSHIVAAAREDGLRIAPQSTGHNAHPLAHQRLDDTVIVKTSKMTGVSINPETRTARVEGGAVWLPVVEAAAAHGLAALHGSSPDVGVAGYSLGGGIFMYARQLGMATNSLTAVELVLADGSHVRADRTQNAELFWALRGGGGSFGVVTALEFRLYPIETAYAGMLVWDQRDAEKVLRRWADWAPGAPDEITTSFRLLNLPPIPDIPEPFRGRRLAVIDGAVLGSDERGAELVAGLRELRPELDTFGRVSAPALARLHMDPEGPTPSAGESSLLAAMPDAAVDALLAEVGPDTTTSLLATELRQLGGQLSRPHPNGGALDRIEGDFLLFGVGMALSPEMGAQVAADARRLNAVLAPWANGSTYLNFAETVVDAKTGYAAESWNRLRAIRSVVDPDGVFQANHVVPRLYEDGRPTA